MDIKSLASKIISQLTDAKAIKEGEAKLHDGAIQGINLLLSELAKLESGSSQVETAAAEVSADADKASKTLEAVKSDINN